ncbi:hypothetical protein ETB97_005890 [Aspergillus alliaceus]|uniref:Uncharacterized protein n=1 Tax=Petromyces alliaceus TaxID=209559 RepID=A0A8H6A0X9_PETAA|nr:hypothetical protein ETB97_005890 [Aspergillus burnettii]
MTSTPPSYAMDSSPPSYEEVVKKLNNLVGPNPTPGKVLEVAKQLSKEDINTLAESYDSHPPLRTDKEKHDFSIGIAKTASSAEAKPYIKPAASSAARAAKEISSIFQQVGLEIVQVDDIHKSNFTTPLQKVQKEYQDVLSDSRLLAVDISQYGSSFDKVIITFCAEGSIPVSERKEKIKQYIQKAVQLEQNAKNIDNRFEDVVQSFSHLVNSFSDWAKDKEGKLTDQIKKLDEELKDLNKKLSRLQSAQAAVTAYGGYATSIAGIIAGLVPPPFSLITAIGGMLAAGASIAVVIGLMIAINNVKEEIEDKTNEKRSLEKDLEKLRQTRQDLVLLGNSSLPSFRSNVQILTGYWKMTIKDAKDIQVWLEKGAQTTDQPQYMKLNLNNAVKSYEVIGQYLLEYAEGVESH